MINISEVFETHDMVEKENLDVRTITMGISLLDCARGNVEETCGARPVSASAPVKLVHMAQGSAAVAIHAHAVTHAHRKTFPIRSVRFIMHSSS